MAASQPVRQGKINGKEALGFYFGAKYGHKPGIWITDPWGKGLEGTPFSEATRERDVGAMEPKSLSCRHWSTTIRETPYRDNWTA